MNPHFLFNSLNSVKHYIIQNKKEDAAYFLSKLSRLLRKILDNSQLQEISLQEELEVMQLYLDVENMRLDHKIDLKIEIDKSINTNQIKLPPLVLQPFIENSIWHGLALIKGEKNIYINVQKTTQLLITIEDNGIGREKAAINKAAKLVEKESLGIELTKQRLEAYTEHLSKKVTIKFEDLYKDDKPAGTKVFISIPLV
jgi:LytS/YehU family sensor histidine kinase